MGFTHPTKLSMPRTKFGFIVSQIVGVFTAIERIVYIDKTPHLMDKLGWDEVHFKTVLLSDNHVRDIFQKHKKKHKK